MIRWTCEKCNKTWIYPIKKCFYCKEKVKRMEVTPRKIIGVTKVVVPSPLHPIVPYNIILLEDDLGNRIPRKTMKEYKVGETFIEAKAKTENAVSIVRTKYDIYDAIKNSLDLINFEVNPDAKILIKPNIESAAHAYQSVCTNPKLIDAVIKFLIDNKVKKENIVVAEQSTFGMDAVKLAARSGILSVCKKQEINFVDLAKTEFEEKTVEGSSFKISKEILNKDLIINIPVLKTHAQYGIAAALENMTRVVDVETQKRMAKAEDPRKQIAYLNKEIKYLTIGDGTIGIQANGPFATGEPSYLNLIMASKDPVALDTVFCETGMLNMPSYLKTASDAGVGNSDINTIEVVGYEVESVKFQLKHATSMSPNPRINVINGMPWSGEYHLLYSLLSKFNNLNIKTANIVIGNNLSKEKLPKERLIAFGDSAIQKLKELEITPMAQIVGTPPDQIQAYSLLKKLLTKEGEVTLTMFDHAKSKIMSKMKNIGG